MIKRGIASLEKLEKRQDHSGGAVTGYFYQGRRNFFKMQDFY
jgi:hypothetical protein